MLKIKINQDIDGYSEGLVMGLSIKEIGHLLLICVCEIVLVILLSLFLPFIAAIYYLYGFFWSKNWKYVNKRNYSIYASI